MGWLEVALAPVLLFIGGWVTNWQNKRKTDIDANVQFTGLMLEYTKEMTNLRSDLESRLATQDEHIAGLSTRLTATERVRAVAIEHIADREEWTESRWPGERPDSLPVVPSVIAAEVLAVSPQRY